MIVFAVMLFAVSAQATKWGGHHVITGHVSGYGNAASMAGGSAGVVTSTESLAGASANLLTKGVVMGPNNSKTNYTGSAGFSTFGTAATNNVVGGSNTFAHTVGNGGFTIVLPNMHHHHHW